MAASLACSSTSTPFAVHSVRSCLQLRVGLRQPRFQTRDVLNEPLGRKPKKVIAKLRILKVQLEQLFIGNGQNVAILEAAYCLRPPVVRIDEAQLAHDTSSRQFDTDLVDEKFPANG